MINFGSTEERAWAAGFFDGEGCFGISTKPSKVRANPCHTSIQITQCEDGQQVLERFKAAIGGFGSVKVLRASKGTHKEVWHYRASTLGEIQTIAGALWNWLSTPKKTQFANVIKLTRAHFEKQSDAYRERSKESTLRWNAKKSSVLAVA